MLSGLNPYQASIFGAISNARIAASTTPCTSLYAAIITGISTTAQVEPVEIAVGLLVRKATKGLPKGKRATSNPIDPSKSRLLPYLLETSAAAFLEEGLFRGVIQRGIGGIQNVLLESAPDAVGSCGIFQYACSPAARILATSSLFALAHLGNGGEGVSQKNAARQAIRTLLFPLYSILYETSGTILAPIAAHLSKNLLIYLWTVWECREAKQKQA